MTTAEVATLVDSNMLLDIVRTGSVWSSWSGQALARVADEGPVVINSIIYPEVSATYATVEEADVVLVGPAFVRAEVPCLRRSSPAVSRRVPTTRWYSG